MFGVAGGSLAIVSSQTRYKSLSKKAHKITTALVQEIKENLPQAIFNGPPHTTNLDKLKRLPNNVNISLSGFNTEWAVVVLDKHGVAASTQSACSSSSNEESQVVLNLTGDKKRASSTIRFSVDPTLKPSDMTRVVSVLKRHLEQMSDFIKP